MQGLKFDSGKPRWDLLPLRLVQHIVEVFTFGASKYGANNWQHLNNGYDRYKAALFRHLVKHENGQTLDEESGLPHLAHAAWNALVLIQFGYCMGEKGDIPQHQPDYQGRARQVLYRLVTRLRVGKKMRLRKPQA